MKVLRLFGGHSALKTFLCMTYMVAFLLMLMLPLLIDKDSVGQPRLSFIPGRAAGGRAVICWLRAQHCRRRRRSSGWSQRCNECACWAVQKRSDARCLMHQYCSISDEKFPVAISIKDGNFWVQGESGWLFNKSFPLKIGINMVPIRAPKLSKMPFKD